MRVPTSESREGGAGAAKEAEGDKRIMERREAATVGRGRLRGEGRQGGNLKDVTLSGLACRADSRLMKHAEA